MAKKKFDFGGYATRSDVLCTDGRVIKPNAFAHQDGYKVPIVWQHDHDDPRNTIGHGYLENRPDGVYIRGIFNDTDRGQHAKALVEHGDISRLSIFAKIGKELNHQVVHGDIKEVSLVFSGANEGAFIDSVGFEHSDDGSYEAVIYGWEDELEHGEELEDYDMDDNDDLDDEEDESEDEEFLDHADGAKGKTVGEILDTMNEEQTNLLVFIIASLMTEAAAKHSDEGETLEHSDDGKDDNMKHNIFEKNIDKESGYIKHADELMADRDAILHSAIESNSKSLKSAFLKHADQTYGIKNIDFLFPEYKELNQSPEFIKRDTGWVSVFLDKAKKTPFAKVKATFAKITEKEARAKGYFTKGTKKLDEVIALLKREISPTTIYKKQKLDRDDLVDMNFNIIAWLKAEMDLMIKEEMARAMLLGDGRTAGEDDKINPLNIIPIYSDDDLYSIKVPVTVGATESKADKFIDAVIKNRKKYKGTGKPILFATDDVITDCLLLKDRNGRYIYKSIDELATTLRVASIETVEVMENITRSAEGTTYELGAIMVNPYDYNIGTNKGGETHFFQDFDIDFNQEKYLEEVRLSGGLVKPHSAMVIEFATVDDTPPAGDDDEPEAEG